MKKKRTPKSWGFQFGPVVWPSADILCWPDVIEDWEPELEDWPEEYEPTDWGYEVTDWEFTPLDWEVEPLDWPGPSKEQE